jgi:aldose 1-epimerase
MSLLAQPYTAKKTTADDVPIVQLVDSRRDIVVSIAPTVGNNAYEMRVGGKNVFWFPYESVGEFAREPKLCGNPFLAPWANRLDEDGFYFERTHYRLNEDLGNLRRDGNGLPIHGLLLYWPKWEVVALEADAHEASVTSRLDFAAHPELLGQFPFAHVVEMTYRLRDGALDVVTRIVNHASRPMPVSVGYHPYFQIHDAPRDQWKVQLPVKHVWKLNRQLVPTGDTVPVEELFPRPDEISLLDNFLDHVFGGLLRESDGTARFSVQGKQEKIEVRYGPNYRAAVVYAPQGEDRDFICFEPMSGITNAFNLAHRSRYDDLQSIAPGGEWVESYSIHPSGF